MSEELLLQEQTDGVLLLTLNRPHAMNALNTHLLNALAQTIDSAHFDPKVRVVIITGTGERAFCSGADLKERATMNPLAVERFLHTLGGLFAAIERLPKPVIAAVNGVALGGGTELALATDIRIAAADANLGLTETRLAIIPGGGGTQRLPRLVGSGKAKELIFTGRRISADEAFTIGLVNQIVDRNELLARCHEMAGMICANGPIAIAQAKYAINNGLETDLHTGIAIEANAYRVCIPTEDRREGLAAFKEKRKPEYKGK